MGSITVTRKLSASPDALWKLVEAFGDTPWIPGSENGRVEGEGPGMARIFQGPDGEIREVLESVDARQRSLVYTIPQGVPFPVTGYRSTMRVSADGDGSSLDWTCEYEPVGVSEEEAGKLVAGMYEAMIGWIDDHLSGKSA